MTKEMILEMAKKMVEVLNDEFFDREEKENMAYAYKMILPNDEITIGKKQGTWVVIEK